MFVIVACLVYVALCRSALTYFPILFSSIPIDSYEEYNKNNKNMSRCNSFVSIFKYITNKDSFKLFLVPETSVVVNIEAKNYNLL
jgi:hypothetical protein